MKKNLLLALVLLFSCSIFAQSRVSFIRQTFDSDEFPSDWSVAGSGVTNWSIWPTSQAGGDPGEVKLYWRPAFNGTARLVSPAVNLTGIDEVVFSFKGFLDNYMDVPHQIGMASTTDDGETWNVIWEESFSTHNQGQHSFVQTVNNADMGKDNVKFCIFYTGDSNNMNGWYFDDIEVYTLDELNLSMLSIDFPNIINIESNKVGFKVQNIGIDAVTSFEAQYQIEGKYPVVETFTTNLEPTEKGDFVFQTPITLSPGTYKLNVTILNVNGEEDITIDNEMSVTVDAAIGSTQRFPMIEHFSNSNCGPCVYVNQSMNILTENNPGKYTYTKYPIRLFFDGDDYYTEESMAKYTYYSVVGLPQVFMDGIDYGAASVPTNDFNEEYNKPAYVDIRGTFNVQDSTVNVIVDVMALVNIPEFRLLVSVNEKTTTGNVGANGETEFHHIMMKMMDDEEGTPTTLNVGEIKRFEFSHNMSGTYVEELNDLEVAVWAQDYITKNIYNSHYMYEYTDVHPYPAQNLQLSGSDEDATIDIAWEAPASGTPVGYNLYINNELVVENSTEMSYHIDNAVGIYTIIVTALYDDNMSSVGLADYIVIGEEIFPCLAPTNLNAAVEQDAEDYEYNFKVTMTWDASDYANQYAVYVDGELVETTSETTYVKGFDEEGEHSFAVATICPDGESEQSEAFSFELIGVSLEEIEDGIKIYPNPASDFVKVSTDNGQQTVVRVYNSIGMLLDEMKTNSSEIEISVSDYNPGIYFINVQTEEGNCIKKIIVE